MRRASTSAIVMLAMCASVAVAQTREPVHRVANAKVDRSKAANRHPIDEALDMARFGLKRMRDGLPEKNLPPIHDYTCKMIKRERINGKLNDYNYMFCKVRNAHVDRQRQQVPFSVYMYFLKPDSFKGREVVYVEGHNNGKLCAHEGGTKGKFLPTVWLKPTHRLAMTGQLYPITDAGLENLMKKLIERGSQERKYAANECEVTLTKGVAINKRPCTLLRVSHPVRRPQYEFSLAEIFIDDELQLPVRYVAYDWPKRGQTRGEIQEEYTYVEIKVNVGLKDIDFDPKNPDYNF